LHKNSRIKANNDLISASLTAPEVLLFSHVAPCYIMTHD